MIREENQNPHAQRKQDPKAIGTTVVFWLQNALWELQSHSLSFSNGPCLTLTVTKGSRILVLRWWYSWILIVVSFPLFIPCVAVRLLGKYRFILLVFSFASFPPQSPYIGIPHFVALYLMVLLRYCFFHTLKFCASVLMSFFSILFVHFMSRCPIW